ncbi:MAG: glycosyltransferase [Pirellulaceae bacterium]|nr:glycosyltransferase [Pirellulaceae bacterium]
MTKRSRPIRILMLLENASFPDDTRVRMQSQVLSAAGYELTVICPTNRLATRKYETVDGVRVFRYPQPPELGGLLGYMIEYGYSIVMQFLLSLFVMMRGGFDAIHMHTPPDVNAIIPAFYRLFGKRFIYDLHDLSPELYHAQRLGRGNRLVTKVLLGFEKFASRTADLLIATNETQRQVQIRRCGAQPVRCHVVRNGPNESFLQAKTSAARPSGESLIVIGYVGVMGIQDGVDYLVRAIDIVVRQYRRDDLRVVLVGHGAALSELQALTRSLGLQDIITFTGRIPFADIPAMIAEFDICCTPDPSNPYNDSCTTIKTMEYMALGKPVVCFETPENIKTAGAAALYAKDNDIQQYARLINQLMGDVELRQKLGAVGRERIEKQLAWKHQASQLVHAYDSLFGITRSWSNRTLELTANCQYSIASLPQSELNGTSAHCELSQTAHYAFPGEVQSVFARHLASDVEKTRLSLAFRMYYLLRPLIPLSVRQFLQRSRRQAIQPIPDWYTPVTFLRELKSAVDCAEAAGHEQPVLHPWPDGQRYAVSLTHDIETAEGQRCVREIVDMEEKYGLKSAWYFVPHKYRLDLGLIRELVARGNEIGIHGYNHDGRLFASQSIFNYRVKHINEAGRRFNATGFRAPMVHRNLQWMQQLEFDYDASCFDIDPYQAMPGGVGSPWPMIVGKLVELPYTLPQDHTLFVSLGETCPRIWLHKLQLLRSISGMALLVTHPDYLKAAVHRESYLRLCEHLWQSPEKWLALPHEIASWWRARQATTILADGTLAGPAAQRGRVTHLSKLLADLPEQLASSLVN